MPVIRIVDRQGDSALYDAVIAEMDLDHNHPAGLIMHGALELVPQEWQIAQVWDSEESARAFERDVLKPHLKLPVLRWTPRSRFLTSEDREPEAWQTNAAGAFLVVGDVGIWSLGDDRFRLQSPAGSEEVEGFAEARTRARELAGRCHIGEACWGSPLILTSPLFGTEGIECVTYGRDCRARSPSRCLERSESSASCLR